jgi:hypothetical protein
MDTAELAELAELAKLVKLGEDRSGLPINYYEVARRARLHLESYEFEAIQVLKDRPSGSTELQQYLARLDPCHCCLNPWMRLAKCRRHGCSRWLCGACLTNEGNCYNQDFCRLQPSPWRAAIRVLQVFDHLTAQKWLEVASIANTCAERIGWEALARLDNNREVTPAKPNQPTHIS